MQINKSVPHLMQMIKKRNHEDDEDYKLQNRKMTRAFTTQDEKILILNSYH
jgi:cell fate regulator YaaT (PSP1 superfamily)